MAFFMFIRRTRTLPMPEACYNNIQLSVCDRFSLFVQKVFRWINFGQRKTSTTTTKHKTNTFDIQFERATEDLRSHTHREVYILRMWVAWVPAWPGINVFAAKIDLLETYIFVSISWSVCQNRAIIYPATFDLTREQWRHVLAASPK